MSAEATDPRLYCVIPAGGAGTRLWPLSRSGRPKFLHDLTGSGRSLLQSTYDRLAPLCDGRVLVVTGARHEAAVAAQLPRVAPGDVLVDPPLSKSGPQAPDRAGASAGPCKPGTPLSGTAVHRTTFFVLDVQARESITCGWRRGAGG